MRSKTVHVISDTFSLKENKDFSNYNIINIIVKENISLSREILKASKNTDLIVLVNLNNIAATDIKKNIKNINCKLIYCSEDNFEKINKISEIATLTPYVIHGFKNDTNNVLYETIKNIIK